MLEMRRLFSHQERRGTAKAALRNENTPSASEPGREAEFGLPSEFWAHFVKNYWCQRPAVFKGILASPLLTPEDVFRGLVTVGDLYRANADTPIVRFFVEQAAQRADIGKYLPEAGDHSIEGYAERINRKLEGRRFGLVINSFYRYDAALYMRLRNFLRGLYEFIDVPSSFVDVALFLGNYKCTPFGVHSDGRGSTNFTFVLAGRKRLLAWPWEFFSDHPNISDSIDYERYRDEAIVLEGEPGDLMCWPSDYWHVAEGGDSLPVTLAIAHEREPQIASSDLFSQVGRFMDERLRASSGAKHCCYNPRHSQKNAEKLPQIVASTRRVLRELSRDKQIEQMLRVSWLNRITSFGFHSVPPPLPHESLADNLVVRGDPRYPIMWLAAEDDEVVCSANGHAFSLTAHPHVLKMLERLNSGEACRVGDLVSEYKGTVKARRIEFEATPKQIRAILEKLYSLRAISPVRSSNFGASSSSTKRTACSTPKANAP